MHILELIFRAIGNLAKRVRMLPQTIELTLQERQRQLARHQFEVERLDRIRHPSKYLGR